ncbi:MAG: glycerophosphodiester phosphodiesterase [Planctomycetota bacterium]
MIPFNRPLIIGHRGFPSAAIENTIPSFQAAIESGARGIECDVRATRDGRPVVFHDEETRRLLGIPGTIRARTSDEIRSLTFPGTDIRIPDLEDILILAEENDAIALVELKGEPLVEITLVRAAIAAVERTRTHGRVAFLSFSHAGIVNLRALAPEIPAAPIFEHTPGIDAALFVGSGWIVIEANAATPRFMEQMRHAGVEVACYGVDSVECDRRLDEIGVGLRITNRPDLLSSGRRALAEEKTHAA